MKKDKLLGSLAIAVILTMMLMSVMGTNPDGGINIPWLPNTLTTWIDEIVKASHSDYYQSQVDPEFTAIVMLVESGGHPGVNSNDVSGYGGAQGLMQVIPSTGEGIATELGIANFDPDSLYQPKVGLGFGAYYLTSNLRAYGVAVDPDWQTSVERAAAAYNGGPCAAIIMRDGYQTNKICIENNYTAISAETRDYVRWVGGMWRERHQQTSPTYEAWLIAGGQRLVDDARVALGLPTPTPATPSMMAVAVVDK